MHQPLPSLKALRAFEAVVRHRSASKAADELHVSPGAVGHQIRSFENEIGFRLFDRSAGEMTPTAGALEIANQVRDGFDQIFGAVRRLRLSRDPSFLTIACDVTFGILWFGPRPRALPRKASGNRSAPGSLLTLTRIPIGAAPT